MELQCRLMPETNVEQPESISCCFKAVHTSNEGADKEQMLLIY